MLHSAAVDRDVILRCSELETDCLSGRNKSLKLGNTDVKLLTSITAGASANDRLAHVLDSEGNVQAEKIAGKLNLVRIENLTAEMARIATAAIGKATIEAAQIHDLQAKVAQIATAAIQDATIQTAQIENLSAVVAELLHAEIKVGAFDLAEVKNLLSEALALEQGTAGSMYITNLAVTSANLLSAMLGKLVLKGEDGKYYQVMVGADGTIHTQEVEPSEAEIEAGETESGLGIVDTSANFADLTAQNIKGNEAIFQAILAQSMTAGKLTAGEALIASATIPTLYATSIQAIGNSLDLSANQSIQLTVKKAVGYRVEVVASSNVLSTEIPRTVIAARVWQGKDEVTEALPAERFAWTRVSADTVADELWAASHKGVKEIELTTLDVYHAATYYCHILDA